MTVSLRSMAVAKDNVGKCFAGSEVGERAETVLQAKLHLTEIARSVQWQVPAAFGESVTSAATRHFSGQLQFARHRWTTPARHV